MKFLKLIILGISICGIILLLSNLDKIFPQKGGDIEPPKLPKVLNPFYDRYQKDWESQKQWNEALYQAHIDSANVYLTRRKINEAEHHDLIYNINATVLDKLLNSLDKQFSANPISEESIQNNLNGIDTVGKVIKNNPQAVKMKNVWKTYVDTKEFISKEYTPGAFPLGMSSDCSIWTSFDTHKRSELNQRDALKSNPLFKEYFSKNTYLNEGLDSVVSKLENCRNGYNSRIAREIKSEYQNVPKFDASGFLRDLSNASTEQEWNYVNHRYDDAWNSFINKFKEKRRKIITISPKFQQEVSDKTLRDEIKGIADSYVVPSQPSKPVKPTFNN